MNYRIVYSIDQLDQSAWDQITTDELAMGSAWQRLMEHGWRNQAPCYVLFEDAAGLAAVMVASTENTFGRQGWREHVLRRLTIVVSAPYASNHCGISMRSDIRLEQLMPSIQRALAELCWKKRRVLYAISSVWEHDVPLWQHAGFSISKQPDYSLLHLPFSSDDAYLKSLASKDRAEIRRIRRKAVEFGVICSIGSFEASELATIYELICQVYARYGTTRETMPFGADMLQHLHREYGDDFILFRGYVNGTLEGVFLTIRSGSSLAWPIAGLNYAVSRSTYLYFILMDEMIRWAIGQGIRVISGGLTNEREKRGHGFHVVERWFCFRAYPNWVNRIFTKGLPLIQRVIGGVDMPPPKDPVVSHSESAANSLP
ncbi:GNAT family N-acetyltransferase [Herpetosiphon gulosus]|uniref:BioF2-like acetyltransferase domain-containing protein n=1 Tax=Herpetosiphon gulosus TaxID=1973496 RepID=A0ABP9X7Z5_9CHLR